ncbi:hypothetical protein FSP39_012144 [Pinctada imbricata]|uniref:Uncharacterized protein n=1 Tax=Pinctada imbricata TaxID=66713 RepID=A0AA88XV66_PINIB|nr:hypothetical protein FSP39_012144 [Pinctada imbricata]
MFTRIQGLREKMTVLSRLLEFWDAVPSYIKFATGATVLASTITIVVLRAKAKSSHQRPKVQYPRDTVILHNPGRGPFAPSLVPFSVKVETYLRILKIPHQTVTDYQKGPKDKWPWIEYNDEVVADSAFIIKFINKTFNVDLDKGFNEEELATAHALRKMMEENTYWTFVMNRWYFDKNNTIHKILHVPSKSIAAMKKRIKENTYQFGIGRHTEEEVNQIMAEDLEALSKFLGNKKFLLGDAVCQADCAIFGQLSQFYWQCLNTPAETTVKSFPNLCKYCERMKDLYWPDWEECNTNGGTKESTA